MGKPFGGSFANLFMARWETSALASHPFSPLLWRRYQDDIFGVWDHNVSDLLAFHRHLNSQHPRITLTLSHGRTVNFLDLCITIDDSRIEYSVYAKDTDTHIVLPRDSHHPPHVFRGLLFGEFLRLASHSSRRDFFDHTVSIVTPVWRSLGYSRAMIRSAKQRVLNRTSQLSLWPTGMFKCGLSCCSVCPLVDSSNTFSLPTKNLCFPIMSRISCSSPNVIYMIKCKACGSTYIGQTRRPLRVRIQQHLRNLRLRHTRAPLYTHFRDSCGLQAFSFKGIDTQPNGSRRRQRETHWISVLSMRAPLGLNIATSHSSPTNFILPYSHCAAQLTSAVRRWCHGYASFQTCYRRSRNLGELLSRHSS